MLFLWRRTDLVLFFLPVYHIITLRGWIELKEKGAGRSGAERRRRKKEVVEVVEVEEAIDLINSTFAPSFILAFQNPSSAFFLRYMM